MSDFFKMLGDALNPENKTIIIKKPIESYPIDTLAYHWRIGDLEKELWVLCSKDQVRDIEQQNREMLEMLKIILKHNFLGGWCAVEPKVKSLIEKVEKENTDG